MVAPLLEEIAQLAVQTQLSGVIHVAREGTVLLSQAFGFADRAHEILNEVDTQFAIASGTKTFTALGVLALVDDGSLDLGTSVREILGDVLELIDPRVTVEHLLAHTSGIGDYLDEETLDDINDYVLTVPVHELASATDYVKVIEGYSTKFEPGSRFEYCNGGYVVLALVIEAVSKSTFHEWLDDRVFRPAGMTSTSFLRSDQLPGAAAIGYLPAEEGWRTNLLHLPVRGVGDGGAYTTVGDMERFWTAVFGGRILPLSVVNEMTREWNTSEADNARYGLGFWIRRDRDTLALVGADAGISFQSGFDRPSGLLYTVISNTSAGAWPIVKKLVERLPQLVASVS